jgi:hypothetical protein
VKKLARWLARVPSLVLSLLRACHHPSTQQGSDYVSNLSLGDEHECCDGTMPCSQSNSICSAAEMDPAMREAVVANAAAAAVTAFASAAAAAAHEQAALPPLPPGSQPRGAGASDSGTAAAGSGAEGGSRVSGSSSPPRGNSQYQYTPGRPPSYHDLARAMREFHEQQMAETRAAAAAAAAAACSPGGGASANGGGPCAGGPAGLAGANGELHHHHHVGAPGLIALDSPPMVEVRLPNGVTLPPAVLAKVAATAATAAASALNEVMPQRNGQSATPSPVCTIASWPPGTCKDE